ncbi:MAG TPA: BON domain-containing protein [Verrucomicrobiae bacterium]|nr:BON domain-containing protein [Verrucomicrobiae bacterium]
MRRMLLMCSLLLALLVGAGCSRKPDDAKITADIQSRFSQDSGLSSKQLSVQSENGVVTLSGAVDNQAQRDAASRQAAAVEGVKEIVNNLQVGTAAAPQPATQPAPSETASAAPAPSRPSAGKKERKHRSADNSGSAANSAKDSNDQMAANDQPNDGQPPADAAAAPAPAAAPADNAPPPPPAARKYIIDQGTQISVRLIDPIDSEKNQAGDTFHATLNTPLSSDGDEAVPAGVELTGHLVDVKSASKFAGQSMVSMQLDSLSYGGKTYSLQTDQYKKQGASRGKNTAEKVGGGAVIGGIIGALAGGGKGAAIGAAAGAGVGGGVQAASKSQQIKLPSETVLNFTLQAPITVERKPSPDENRPKLTSSESSS